MINKEENSFLKDIKVAVIIILSSILFYMFMVYMPSTDEQIKDLEEQITELRNTNEDLEQNISSANYKIETLQAEKDFLENENNKLSSQLEDLTVEDDEPTATLNLNVSNENTETVYVTNTGNKYHRAGCSYLKKSSNAISKDSAISQGYTPCSRCNP